MFTTQLEDRERKITFSKERSRYFKQSLKRVKAIDFLRERLSSTTRWSIQTLNRRLRHFGVYNKTMGGYQGQNSVFLFCCAILLFCYDVLSFCFNILSFCYSGLMCSYSVLLCYFVVLLWCFVILLFSVLFSCCFVMWFCYAIPSCYFGLLFRWGVWKSRKPESGIGTGEEEPEPKPKWKQERKE